jgi:signal transduction histidine kinase/DNA-binding response OmpR family regulator
MNSERAEIFDNDVLKEVSIVPVETADGMQNLLLILCSTLLMETVDYKSLLDTILVKILEITQSDFGSIIGDNGEYLCIISSSSSDTVVDIPKQRHSLFDVSIRKKTIIISNNVSKDPRKTHETKYEGRPEISTFIGIPLIKNDRTIGQLAMANKKGGYNIDSPVVRTLATGLRPAITNLLSRCLHPYEKQNKDDSKERFLATMSHELRTPLNGIVGMVTLLSEQPDFTEKQKEYVKVLMQCSSQLLTLINNILDFSKMASKNFTLLKNPLSIEGALQTTLGILDSKARAKGLAIETHINKFPPMIGDQPRLVQILLNIVTNAIKYTESGKIIINVHGKPVEKITYPKKWKIVFEVCDTGIGISPAMQSKIFQAYNSAATIDTQYSKNGTGLGLAISRELIKMMGGRIGVTSDGIPGKGSKFVFSIMVSEDFSSLSNDIKGAKILAVDDRAEIRMQLTECLLRWGCTPTVVSSGSEALTYLKHATDRFEVCIVDICMPNMDGVELAQEIRMKYPKLPLIALSSASDTRSVELFDYYLNKPVDAETLFPAVASCCAGGYKRRSLYIEQPNKRKRRSKCNLRILIAEDDATNIYTMVEMLVSMGYTRDRIKAVENGKECVQELKRRRYNVVLLDVVMPIMDGIEAAKEISQMKSPPYMILVTASQKPVDLRHSLVVDGYLIKPVLKTKLETVLTPLIR